MASLTPAYTDETLPITLDKPRARRGRPHRPQLPTTAYERANRYGPSDYFGSHMPLDADIHWHWRNPLNILPALLLVLFVLAVVAMVWS